MGLLRDTYIINKTDTSGIEYQIRRKNDIEEKQNAILNITKDRVDISLNEYETLKNDLEKTKMLLSRYENFIKDLAKSIRQNPEILLNSKVVKSELEKTPLIDGYNLYVIWEIQNKDLL